MLKLQTFPRAHTCLSLAGTQQHRKRSQLMTTAPRGVPLCPLHLSPPPLRLSVGNSAICGCEELKHALTVSQSLACFSFLFSAGLLTQHNPLHQTPLSYMTSRLPKPPRRPGLSLWPTPRRCKRHLGAKGWLLATRVGYVW